MDKRMSRYTSELQKFLGESKEETERELDKKEESDGQYKRADEADR